MSNKLIRMAREILAIEDDLPYRLDYSNERPTIDDFDMYDFDQVWGSTALGFGGMGGDAMTSARTYVFVPNYGDQKCFVYFGGRFAYAVPYCEKLMNDIRGHHMEPVNKAGKYKT